MSCTIIHYCWVYWAYTKNYFMVVDVGESATRCHGDTDGWLALRPCSGNWHYNYLCIFQYCSIFLLDYFVMLLPFTWFETNCSKIFSIRSWLLVFTVNIFSKYHKGCLLTAFLNYGSSLPWLQLILLRMTKRFWETDITYFWAIWVSAPASNKRQLWTPDLSRLTDYIRDKGEQHLG